MGSQARPSGPVVPVPPWVLAPGRGGIFHLAPGPGKAAVLPPGNDVRGAVLHERLCPWGRVGVPALRARGGWMRPQRAGVKLAEPALLYREQGCT